MEGSDFRGEADFSDFKSLEITIVGLGLIGGSYALALKKLQPKKIWAVDIDQEVLSQAERLAVIDEGFSQGEVPLKRSDLVIVSVYPEQAISFMRENREHFKTGALITDAAGNKAKIVQEIQSLLRADLEFVGGHPLAGKECSGFTHASADIFQGANYLLTPVPGNKEESLLLLEKLIKGLGCREPIRISPAEHDRIIAYTSQLPHVLAAALMNSNRLQDIGKLTGGSFRDASRVAGMNGELWSELLMDNKENILTEIELFVDNITNIKQALQNEDRASLQEILRQANEGRKRI